MNHVVFNSLKNIKITRGCCTYYQPRSWNFGASDAFILDTTNLERKCYCLQMTIKASRGIKGAPLTDFVKWLNERNLRHSLYLIFVVPNEIRDTFQKQPIKTVRDTEYKNIPLLIRNVRQYKCSLDFFYIK